MNQMFFTRATTYAVHYITCIFNTIICLLVHISFNQ